MPVLISPGVVFGFGPCALVLVLSRITYPTFFILPSFILVLGGRTAVAGRRPSGARKEPVETAAGIVDCAMAAIRPGVPVIGAARLGDRLTSAFGGDKDQGAEKWPFYGHGIGLFFEKPYVSTQMGSAGDVFQEGMVLRVEAFLAREGVGSAGFEQHVIVTKDGTELLITSPMPWW